MPPNVYSQDQPWNFEQFLMTTGERVGHGPRPLYSPCHLSLMEINSNLIWQTGISLFNLVDFDLANWVFPRGFVMASVWVYVVAAVAPAWGFPNPYDIQVLAAGPLLYLYPQGCLGRKVSAIGRDDIIRLNVWGYGVEPYALLPSSDVL